MSRRKLRGYEKVTVSKGPLRPRTSRHGKPLSDVFKLPGKVVKERSVVTDPVTKTLKVVYKEVILQEPRAMTPDEIQEARKNVLRADASTIGKRKPRKRGGKK